MRRLHRAAGAQAHRSKLARRLWLGAGGRPIQFEAYCERNRLDPAPHRANYGFLLDELRGSERRAIFRLQNARSLADTV
jgi:hypothetical protein